jgi:hypothetical protein
LRVASFSTIRSAVGLLAAIPGKPEVIGVPGGPGVSVPAIAIAGTGPFLYQAPPPRARNQPASESLMVSNGLKARRAGRLRFWMHLANADILRPSRETLPSASARIWGWRPGARPVSWNRATREYKHGRDPAAIGSWRQLCNAARFPGFMRLARPESAGGSGWCRKHLPQLAASRVGYHAYSW